MTENENNLPSAEAQKQVPQASDTKAATATASVELSEDELEAVAGGGFFKKLNPYGEG